MHTPPKRCNGSYSKIERNFEKYRFVFPGGLIASLSNYHKPFLLPQKFPACRVSSRWQRGQPWRAPCRTSHRDTDNINLTSANRLFNALLLDIEQKTGLIYLLSAAFVSPICLIKQGVLFIDRNFCRVWESNRTIRGQETEGWKFMDRNTSEFRTILHP